MSLALLKNAELHMFLQTKCLFRELNKCLRAGYGP
jgi:hypothetical protein